MIKCVQEKNFLDFSCTHVRRCVYGRYTILLSPAFLLAWGIGLGEWNNLPQTSSP